MPPETARPPPAPAALPPPAPNENWPIAPPVPPQGSSSDPPRSKRTIRLLPSATRTLPSLAAATAPTEVSSPGRVPAAPSSPRTDPSGPQPCTECEPWSPTYTVPSGATATACGKRSTPPLRCPTASMPVYGHDEAGSAPGQSARAAGASSTKAAAAAGITRLQGIDCDQHPKPRKVALGRARKKSCRSLI